MKIFTTGEKVWGISIVLFLIWAIAGNSLGIPVRTISIYGFVGMILFVTITLSIIFVLRNKKRDK